MIARQIQTNGNDGPSYEHTTTSICSLSNRMEHREYRNSIMKPQVHEPHLIEDNLTDHIKEKLSRRQESDDLQVTDVDDLQSELMTCHHRLDHCSFRILQSLPIFGVIPKKLATVRPPRCTHAFLVA